MLRIGLLGAGRIGQVHARAIAANANSRLSAVSDVFAENAELLARQYSTDVKTSEQIIADPDIDAVLVATSTDTHSPLIEAATSAGKPVLCEKPVDLSLERALACKRHVDNTAVPVMIGLNRRFDPTFKSLKSALNGDEIGRPELISITSFDPAPPPIDYVKVSGGLFRDMMIHDFDMANFFNDCLPDTISAQASSIVDASIGEAGDVDTAVVTMTYPDGRIAVIKNSRRAAYGYDQRIEILGSKGLLQAQNKLENSMVKSTADGVVSAKPVHFFLERYMPAYEAEWAAFVDALTAGSAMPVTLDDGVAALAMAEAATQSSQTGMPVKLADHL